MISPSMTDIEPIANDSCLKESQIGIFRQVKQPMTSMTGILLSVSPLLPSKRVTSGKWSAMIIIINQKGGDTRSLRSEWAVKVLPTPGTSHLRRSASYVIERKGGITMHLVLAMELGLPMVIL